MENQLNTEQAEQQTQNYVPQSSAPVQIKRAKRVRPAFVAGTLCLLIGVALGFATGYIVRERMIPAEGSQAAVSQATGSTYAAGYRDGTNGTALTADADVVANELLASLKLSYKQQVQYPDTLNEYMAQILMKYGYSSHKSLSGPDLKCPADNGYFYYQPYKDQETRAYKTFDLYYCKDSTLVHKSQLDIK